MFNHTCSRCGREFKTKWRRNYYCEDCRKNYNKDYYKNEKAEGREIEKDGEKTLN